MKARIFSSGSYRFTTLYLLALLVLVAGSCNQEPQDSAPKNIILLIGDGMGISHVTATRIKHLGQNGYLHMERMPFTGFMRTHSADDLITDSAAAATAMATGYKTDSGMIGVIPDSQQVQTIVEACRDRGMRTGIVATSSITHATPAAMASHVYSRSDQQAIAEQLIENRVNVLLGGGVSYFTPQTAASSKRKDDRNLLARASELGYTVVRSAAELKVARPDYLLGLFAEDGMSGSPDEPTLAEMTSIALELLGTHDGGFFIMVEGSQIDWEAHDHRAEGVFSQTIQFDEAVKVALDFATRNSGTLVVVTADHETGGMAINGGELSGNVLDIGWTTEGHTGVMVPCFAQGPGGASFVGVYDNTDLPKKFASLLGIIDFPKIAGR